MNKNVLFYSNRCVYSRDALQSITMRDLRSFFVIVCVDKRNTIQLPDFVDRVPLIYTIDKRVLTDEAVDAFIDTLSKQVSARAPANDDVSPWSTIEMGCKGGRGGGMSDMFSFLECGDGGGYSHNFADIHEHQSIPTPEEDSGGGKHDTKSRSQRHGGGQASLETFMAMRDNDLKPFMPPRAPV